MGARIRRGEELPVTRTLARLGIPILRTIPGSGVMEGGSFARLNARTCAIGVGFRVNREGAEQVGEVLQRQGVDLLIVDLVGYDIHFDVSFLMIDRDLAILNPMGLPYSFLQDLTARDVRYIETDPGDDPWIVNSLAVSPGKILIPGGATNRTPDRLAAAGVSWISLPCEAVQKNGGGLHCSATPLRRDPV